MNNRNSFEQKLLSFFNLKKKNYTLEELHKLFDLNDEEIECFDDALLQLQIKANIYLNDNDEYVLFPVNTNLVVGQLKINKKGKHYIVFNDQIIYLYDNYLKDAIIGDIVLVNKDKHTLNGKVKNIIYRDTNKIVVDVVNNQGNIKLIPYDKSFKFEINLKKNDLQSLVDGDRIVLKLEEIKKGFYNGTIIYHIGNKNEPNLDIKTLAILDGINVDFSKEALEEANNLFKEITEKDIKGRLDLRRKRIFTIDGKDTKDMDDAISLEINNKGNYVLGVHIADVSYYIKEGSALFNEAYKRGTSFYPANFVIPMFPSIVSNGICSLNPKEDRLTLSCIMEIDANGNLIDYQIEESVINSRKKMSYKEVNKILEQNQSLQDYEEYIDDLKLMQQLHKVLNKKKISRGYLDFGNGDVKISIDSNGNVSGIKQITRGVSEKIIEDFMLMANETVAQDIYYKSLPFIYRVHGIPNEDKMQEILTKINELGFKIKCPNSLKKPYAIQSILKQISNLEIYPILAEMILQGVPRATYNTENIGHFGLALKNYTHFTSPIRRFPDLMVHKLLKEYKNNNYEAKFEELDEIANHCTKKQKQADDFERKINTIKAAEYMENHKEEEFVATICYIGSKNLLLKIENGIYGKLLLVDLNDKYKFIPSKMILMGKNNQLNLGDQLIVKVKEINDLNKNIYFKECSVRANVRKLQK